MDPKISSIIKKNDELINLLDSLRQQNEQELVLYKEVNNLMPWQVTKLSSLRYSKIVTKEKILEKLGKALTEENYNAINVNIMRLRKKIEYNNNKCLKTIRNQGFLLKP